MSLILKKNFELETLRENLLMQFNQMKNLVSSSRSNLKAFYKTLFLNHLNFSCLIKIRRVKGVNGFNCTRLEPRTIGL